MKKSLIVWGQSCRVFFAFMNRGSLHLKFWDQNLKFWNFEMALAFPGTTSAGGPRFHPVLWGESKALLWLSCRSVKSIFFVFFTAVKRREQYLFTGIGRHRQDFTCFEGLRYVFCEPNIQHGPAHLYTTIRLKITYGLTVECQNSCKTSEKSC